MATLLRKLRSSTNDKAYTANSDLASDGLSLPVPTKAGTQSWLRRNRVIEEKQAEKSIRFGRRGRHPGIITTLRGIGRAPSLHSHSKHRQENLGTSRGHPVRAHTLFAFESNFQAYDHEHDFDSLIRPSTATTTADSAPPPILRQTSTNSLATASGTNLIQHWKPHTRSRPETWTAVSQNIPAYRQHPYKNHLQGHIASDGYAAWIEMASEHAAPPVSYERLRQVTTEACDKTLSSIKAYNHGSTEAWNTQIINAILATLVQESTSSSTSASHQQPNFKFVVNSTIIQHAQVLPGAGDDAVKSAGRRGMHSASGAYWNNEKDGMWSFKYEAAEAKGLDVVVGITWIWVG